MGAWLLRACRGMWIVGTRVGIAAHSAGQPTARIARRSCTTGKSIHFFRRRLCRGLWLAWFMAASAGNCIPGPDASGGPRGQPCVADVLSTFGPDLSQPSTRRSRAPRSARAIRRWPHAGGGGVTTLVRGTATTSSWVWLGCGRWLPGCGRRFSYTGAIVGGFPQNFLRSHLAAVTQFPLQILLRRRGVGLGSGGAGAGRCLCNAQASDQWTPPSKSGNGGI